MQALEDVLAQPRRHLLDRAPREMRVHVLVELLGDRGNLEALQRGPRVAHPGPPVARVEVAHHEVCQQVFAVLDQAGALEAETVAGGVQERGEGGAVGHYEGVWLVVSIDSLSCWWAMRWWAWTDV